MRASFANGMCRITNFLTPIIFCSGKHHCLCAFADLGGVIFGMVERAPRQVAKKCSNKIRNKFKTRSWCACARAGLAADLVHQVDDSTVPNYLLPDRNQRNCCLERKSNQPQETKLADKNREQLRTFTRRRGGDQERTSCEEENRRGGRPRE